MFEPLVEEPFSVVVRAGHPLARRRRLVVADLVDQPSILPPFGTDLRARLDALCVQQGLPLLKSVVETVSIRVMLNLLRLSDALVLLPQDYVRPYCTAGSLAMLRIDLGVRSERYGLITRRHHTPSAQLLRALQVFRESALATFPALQQRDG